MITIRQAEARGHAHYGWLDTYYTFSFANYYDPQYLGFSSLRVINEDKVTAGKGFETHGHRDMEIITYVLEGALEHRDSLGNGSIIYPGEVQIMSAGTGILHSEFNPSKTDLVHLLQIWIIPDTKGLEPRYEQKKFELVQNPGKLHLIASSTGKEGSVMVHQNVDLYAGILAKDDSLTYQLSSQRQAWIQVVRGEIILNGINLKNGDGAAITEETKLVIEGKTKAEILLFDLANQV